MIFYELDRKYDTADEVINRCKIYRLPAREKRYEDNREQFYRAIKRA